MKVKAEFKTILGKTENEVRKKVQEYLNEGWEIGGGICIDTNPGLYGNQNYVCYQAIFKHTMKG